MQIDRANIVKIVEVSGADEAQRYLDLGWILLGQASQDGEVASIIYSLGWSSEKGEAHLPKEKYPAL